MPVMALALACVALVVSASPGCGHSASPGSTLSAMTPRVQTYTADWDPAALTVSSLASEADVIVRGRVTRDPTARWNSADGKQWKPKSAAEGPQFYTTWIIRVDEALKGSAKVGDLVDFRYVGGTVDFNGHRAHYVGNDYPDLSKDDQVIVFGIAKTTMQNTAGLPGFWLLAGGLSVFRLEDGQFVRVVEGGGAGVSNVTSIDAIRESLDHPGSDAGSLPATMPPDFALVASFGVGAGNTLDTSAGTFTKDLVGGTPGTATAGLRLTSAELAGAYQGLVQMDVLSYPSEFHPDYAEVTIPGMNRMVTPSMSYSLRIHAAGVDKDISWDDSNGSTVAKAVALREWFKNLMQVIQAKPDYKALPPARGGYL